MANLTVPGLSENFFLIDALSFNMKKNPTRPFFVYSDFETSEIKIITHLELGRAAHRVAHVVRPNRSGVDGQVVALILHADTILYHAITAGLMVAGHVPFPISPGNSVESVIDLLVSSSCHRIITSKASLQQLIDSLKSRIATRFPLYDLCVEDLPPITSVYPFLAQETLDHPFKPYPGANERPSKDDLCIYLHSSGSTGNPRAVPLSHMHWVQHAKLASEAIEFTRGVTGGYMCMAGYHTFGVACQLFRPIMGVLSAGVFPPTSILRKPLPPIMPSPENALDHAKRIGSGGLVVAPMFLQIWSQQSDAIAYLKTLKFVGYGGVPLAPKLGNLLVNEGVKLHQVYGGTEFGLAAKFARTGLAVEDWEYVEFHDELNVCWEPQDDGLFEYQILSSDEFEVLITNLPDDEGYASGDLFSPHPSNKGLWKFIGRIDDKISHSSAEKTTPGPMETLISNNPLVQAAVVFGQGQPQAGVLIELRIGHLIDVEDVVQVAYLRNKLWETIEEVNYTVADHSRISKEMILIASKGKSLPRGGKGSVLRAAALKLYEIEIIALYGNVDDSRFR